MAVPISFSLALAANWPWLLGMAKVQHRQRYTNINSKYAVVVLKANLIEKGGNSTGSRCRTVEPRQSVQ